jgi:hypothetical protein
MHAATVLVHEPTSTTTAPSLMLLNPPKWESLALAGLDRSNYASTIANHNHKSQQDVALDGWQNVCLTRLSHFVGVD